jgi:hypothetical protein
LAMSTPALTTALVTWSIATMGTSCARACERGEGEGYRSFADHRASRRFGTLIQSKPANLEAIA